MVGSLYKLQLFKTMRVGRLWAWYRPDIGRVQAGTNRRFSFVFVLCIIVYFILSGISCQCVNEAGNPVDWFVMLKMPNGVNYLYAGFLD